MSKEEDYRQKAAETIDLANHAGNSSDKGRLLRLAEKWLDLADRAHQLPRRLGPRGSDHPLVSKALGRQADTD